MCSGYTNYNVFYKNYRQGDTAGNTGCDNGIVIIIS